MFIRGHTLNTHQQSSYLAEWFKYIRQLLGNVIMRNAVTMLLAADVCISQDQ
jgi:hypothetical protein